MKTSLSKKGNTYQGKKVTLNKPFYTPGERKKSAVYVKNDNGNVIKVRFGDANMEIKRDNPERRKNFRARHNCATAKDKTTPKYWSCAAWGVAMVGTSAILSMCKLLNQITSM
jgi:hypothetical protein